MKNKKTIIICAIVVIAILSTVIGIIFKAKNHTTSGCTRYELIEAIADEFKMTEYRNSSPYYKDVASDDKFFESVQAAYEWSITEQTDKFNGSDRIKGKEVAISAFKAVGPYRVKLYLNNSDLPTDKDYANLAVREGLIAEKELNGNLSTERVREIVSDIREFGMSTLWIDDYADVKYMEGVKELGEEDVVSYDMEGGRLELKDTTGLEKGSVIVFYNNYSNLKNTGRVTKISGNNVEIEETDLSDAIEHLVISDIMQLSSEDIQRALQNSPNAEEKIQTADFGDIHLPIDLSKKHSGATIEVEISSDGDASISLTDNETGITKSFGLSGISIQKSSFSRLDSDISADYKAKDSNKPSVDGSVYFKTSFNLSEFDIGLHTDIDKNLLTGDITVNSFATQVETQVDIDAQSGCKLETKIPLGTVTVAGQKDIAGVNISLYMIISLDGSVSFGAEFPAYAVFEYQNGTSPRYDSGVNCNTKEMELCCNIEDKLEIQPNVVVLGYKLFDMELDVGAGASAKVTMRKKSNILFCADIDFYAPILSVGWLNGGSIMENFTPSVTYDIFTSKNALIKNKLHYERYKDRTGRFVDPCTYGEGEQEELDLSMPHTYFAEFTGPFKAVDGHYEATGKLYSQAFALKENVDKLAVGKSFECDGVTFTLTEEGTEDGYGMDDNGNLVEKPLKWYILDDKYIISEGNEGAQASYRTGESVEFYNIYLLDPEAYSPRGKEKVFILIDNEFTFKTGEYYGGEEYKNIETGEWYLINFEDGSGMPEEKGKIYGIQGGGGYPAKDDIYIIDAN